MTKREIASKCLQIRDMINSNQYLKAMEEIEHLDFSLIPSIRDIYDYADIFMKAERLDIAKELYYTVYRRRSTRQSLRRLLMLVIRMDDLEEARELLLAYEIICGESVDTYEMKYRLAKAEGRSRTYLIEILEELNSQEYTEEWGYQLATLYEMEGMREKCIDECEKLKLWFGYGNIIDKADELRERCMSPYWEKPEERDIPEPIRPDYSSLYTNVTPVATVKVKEITGNEMDEPEEPVKKDVIYDDSIIGDISRSLAQRELEAERRIKEESSEEPEEVAEEVTEEPEEATEEVVEEPEEEATEEVTEEPEEEATEEVTEEPEEEAIEEVEEVAEEPEEVAEEPVEEPADEQNIFATDSENPFEFDLPEEKKSDVIVDESVAIEEEEPEEKKKPKKGFLSKFVNLFKVDLDEEDDEEDSEEDIEDTRRVETLEDVAIESEEQPTEEPEEEDTPVEDAKPEVNGVEMHKTGKVPVIENEIEAERMPVRHNPVVFGENNEAGRMKTIDDNKSQRELDTYKQQSTAEIDVQAILAGEVQGVMDSAKKSQKKRKDNIESLDDTLSKIGNTGKVESLDATLDLEKKMREKGLRMEAPKPAVPENVPEEISENGIIYRTLKNTIYKFRSEDKTIHFALAGGGEGISLAVAKRLFKEMRKLNYFTEAKYLGKVDGEKIDTIDLMEWAEKFIGGCMYINNAPSMSVQGIANLIKMMDSYNRQIVVILAGDDKEIEDFLVTNKELETRITYKVKL
ncbi:hypothetical protein [Eubacterium xylanophilum]|uniref:hypothetical protein n=1 Tax=Eubacterium xylanophilum TaxID=39497 RepID=UPI00047DB04A|nr:hypothetical protein [Eubacterium xylanophilum]